MTQVNVKNILKEVLSLLNPRVRDVIEKRFGLRDGKSQTLEAIGRGFGITRERVRQIESDGLRQLSRPGVIARLDPVFAEVDSYFNAKGGVEKEEEVFKNLGQLLLSDEKFQVSLVNFLLTLGQARFYNFDETEGTWKAWANKKEVYSEATLALRKLEDSLLREGKSVSYQELLNTFKSLLSSFSNLKTEEPVLCSFLALSKNVNKNPFDDWGLSHWTEISPRGVKDKAYLVFKREGKPLHFRQVADLINLLGFSPKKAHPQTVHNELIKDPRFILVGRGTYALRDWGYESGTVCDVIVSVMKKQANPLTREEVIKHVLSKRLVKENTILLNLQNRKIFGKSKDGKYTLV